MDFSRLTDEQLVAADAHGRTEALAELVRRHQDHVLTLAYRFVGRWDLAEDVCQEAFLSVHRAVSRFEPRAKFTTWLHRIVVNLCLDEKRRLQRAPVPLEDPDLAVDDDTPRDVLEARERARRVKRAVEDLPERQRVALLLHRWEGLSHREVADVTGWSASAVESLLVRAYATLRRELAGLE